MVKTDGLLAPALLALAISVGLASSAEARHRKYRYYDFRYPHQFQDVRQVQHVRQYQDDPLQSREDERRDRGAFTAIVAKLVHSCRGQAAELDRLPFDAIAQITRPDDTQHAALDELRSSVAATVNKLTSECPREISAPFSAQLDDVIQGIDTTVAGLDAVRPALQNYYGTLEDEQKARLLVRGLLAVEAQAQVQERSSQSERWRVFNGGPAPTPHPLGAVCEQLTASLRDWPIRQMESDMGLSDPQRIALYELAIASLKASNTLACPAEGALTPVGRLDTMRLRLSAMRAAVSAVRPALLHFYEVLNERQKQRFAQM
jgi:hypothetical protein